MPPRHRPVETAAELTRLFGPEPFSVRAALVAGVTPGRLRAAVRAARLRSVRYGVLSAAPAPTRLDEQHRERVQAVLATVGVPAVVSHGSAALLLGLPYPAMRPPEEIRVELTGRAWAGRGSPDWTRHHADVSEDEIAVRHGVRVTGLARTAVDVARSRRGPDALIVVDAAMRRMIEHAVADEARPPMWDAVRSPHWIQASRDRMAALAAGLVGAPGIAQGRRWLAAGHPAADTPLESYSRGVLLEAGLPEPTVGLAVVGDDGRTYWPDMAWQRFRVLAECDGRGKYTDLDVLYREKRRQEALERAGWLVVRWTWEEIVHHPEVVLRRIARALRARGWDG